VRPRLQVATLGLLILIWGTTWAAIRVGLGSIPPFVGAALRFGIAALVLLAIARARGVRLGTSARERWLWLINGAFSFAISYGIVYWAEQYVPSGLASVLFASFPLFVALMSHFLLPGERLTLTSGLGVLVGFLGIVILYSEDLASLGGPKTAFAATIFLLSPLASAIAQVIVKRWGEGIHPLSLTSVPMALTAVSLGAMALLFERDRPFHVTPAGVVSVLYLALIGSALAFTLFFALLAQMPATQLSLITFLIPIVAVLVGVFFFDEPFTLRIVAGTLAIVAGVALAAWPAPRRTS
jgi:drug/metabolite transporter (DMT)-like permease